MVIALVVIPADAVTVQAQPDAEVQIEAETLMVVVMAVVGWC